MKMIRGQMKLNRKKEINLTIPKIQKSKILPSTNEGIEKANKLNFERSLSENPFILFIEKRANKNRKCDLNNKA